MRAAPHCPLPHPVTLMHGFAGLLSPRMESQRHLLRSCLREEGAQASFGARSSGQLCPSNRDQPQSGHAQSDKTPARTHRYSRLLLHLTGPTWGQRERAALTGLLPGEHSHHSIGRKQTHVHSVNTHPAFLQPFTSG